MYNGSGKFKTKLSVYIVFLKLEFEGISIYKLTWKIILSLCFIFPLH